jgi:hypothetical protein
MGILEVVGEGLDHGHEPCSGGHERSENAFVGRPVGAHGADTGGDHSPVERLAEVGVHRRDYLNFRFNSWDRAIYRRHLVPERVGGGKRRANSNASSRSRSER